jgi:hypothetical protein
MRRHYLLVCLTAFSAGTPAAASTTEETINVQPSTRPNSKDTGGADQPIVDVPGIAVMPPSPSGSDCETPRFSGQLARIYVMPTEGENYFIRPFLWLNGQCGDLKGEVVAYSGTPYIRTHLAQAAVSRTFSWGSIAVGEFDYSMFGTTGTLLGTDRFTIPSPVFAYRYVGAIGGLGAQVELQSHNHATTFSITDSAINDTPRFVPNNLGRLNFRVEHAAEIDDFTFSVLGIVSTPGSLPRAQGRAVGSETVGGAISYKHVAGPVEYKLGVEAAYNTHYRGLIDGTAELVYHLTPRLNLDLLASTMNRQGLASCSGLQALAGYDLTPQIALTLGGGKQIPGSVYGVAAVFVHFSKGR